MIGKAVGEKMVKAIVRDPLFLAQKSVPATEADKQVVLIFWIRSGRIWIDALEWQRI